MVSFGFYLGRFTTVAGKYFKVENNFLRPLRLSGYKYSSPLLACDTEVEISSPQMDDLANKLNNLIESEKDWDNLSSVSIYIRNYNGGTTININPDEKYYPASLNKIPVMMAAYKTEWEKSGFLNTKHIYNLSNFNETVEIKPSDYLFNGKIYTIQEAIDKMIKNSDNNALYFLYNYIDGKMISQTFKDLAITSPSEEIVPNDYMTVKEFSYFLRVLYNSSYLPPDYSEKALELLSQSEYKKGIVAGVPKDIKVAHKFGIRTYENNRRTERELHDCGIIYKKSEKPYLLCVMTKSNASIVRIESSIKEISRLVYKYLQK